MRPFHNTPQPHNPPNPIPPEKTGKELIEHLEKIIENYLDDCKKGYCHLDKKELEKLRTVLRIAQGLNLSQAEVHGVISFFGDPKLILRCGNV